MDEVHKSVVEARKHIVPVSIENYQSMFKIDQPLKENLKSISASAGIPLSEVVIDGSEFMPDSVKKLFSEHPDHMSVTRRNIIEMVDSAIFSFLKLPPAGKFDSTEVDAIFHAKHDLLLGMLPEIEKGWRDICETVYQKIRELSTEDLIVVMNLELRYAVEPKFK